MLDALTALMNNLQGVDAAILAICIIMWKVIKASNKDQLKESIVGLKMLTILGVCLILARVLITLIDKFPMGV